MRKIVFLLLFSLMGIALSPLFSQQIIPEIKKLSIKDIYYKQLYFDIETAWKARTQNTPAPKMHIFRYTVTPRDDFFKLTAAFSIPGETLATLNGLESPSNLKSGVELLICNRQGLFIPVSNKSSRFSQFMRHTRFQQLETAPQMTIRGEKYYFLENERFSSVEQAFFLKILYHYPVDEGILTSGFGSRVHPITNLPSWHKGIDIAAPLGSKVYASNKGEVVDTGSDAIYGNYILLRHPNGYDSFYAHLSEVNCRKGSTIAAGNTIGKVGTTGLSTGPHLHFEIRKDGKALNPDHFLLK